MQDCCISSSHMYLIKKKLGVYSSSVFPSQITFEVSLFDVTDLLDR